MCRDNENRIMRARYNKKYKEIELEGRKRILRRDNLDKIGKRDEVRAMIKLKCENGTSE